MDDILTNAFDPEIEAKLLLNFDNLNIIQAVGDIQKLFTRKAEEVLNTELSTYLTETSIEEFTNTSKTIKEEEVKTFLVQILGEVTNSLEEEETPVVWAQVQMKRKFYKEQQLLLTRFHMVEGPIETKHDLQLHMNELKCKCPEEECFFKCKTCFNKGSQLCLGVGSYAVAFYALWVGTPVAVKAFNKTAVGLQAQKKQERVLESFQRELNVLKSLRHPNIIGLYGYDAKELYLVMEVARNGSLADKIRLNKNREWANTVWPVHIKIALEITAGVKFLHNRGIIHGDLKSFNILLDSNYTVKIADFGTSGTEDNKPTDCPLSIAWAAPERLLGEGISKGADIYALGIILWELATLQLPYNQFVGSPQKLASLILHAKLRPEIQDHLEGLLSGYRLSPLYVWVMQKIWQTNAKNRLTPKEIYKVLLDVKSAWKCAKCGWHNQKEETLCVGCDFDPFSPEQLEELANHGRNGTDAIPEVDLTKLSRTKDFGETTDSATLVDDQSHVNHSSTSNIFRTEENLLTAEQDRIEAEKLAEQHLTTSSGEDTQEIHMDTDSDLKDLNLMESKLSKDMISKVSTTDILEGMTLKDLAQFDTEDPDDENIHAILGSLDNNSEDRILALREDPSGILSTEERKTVRFLENLAGNKNDGVSNLSDTYLNEDPSLSTAKEGELIGRGALYPSRTRTAMKDIPQSNIIASGLRAKTDDDMPMQKMYKRQKFSSSRFRNLKQNTRRNFRGDPDEQIVHAIYNRIFPQEENGTKSPSKCASKDCCEKVQPKDRRNCKDVNITISNTLKNRNLSDVVAIKEAAEDRSDVYDYSKYTKSCIVKDCHKCAFKNKCTLKVIKNMHNHDVDSNKSLLSDCEENNNLTVGFNNINNVNNVGDIYSTFRSTTSSEKVKKSSDVVVNKDQRAIATDNKSDVDSGDGLWECDICLTGNPGNFDECAQCHASRI